MTLSSIMKYKKKDEKTMEGETKAARGTHGEISLTERKYTTQAQSLRNFPKLTNFSIENILRKDFGRTIQKHRHNYQHFLIRHVVNKLRVEDIFRGKVLLESEERKTRGSPPLSPVIRAKAKTLSSRKAVEEPRDSSPSGTPLLWPAWVYCTRYSDRPSSGPRTRKIRSRRKKDEKRPPTAFSAPQLQRLRQEFQVCNYLTEERRRSLAVELNLSESQIKIWFQNKRAKIKKAHGYKNPLAMNLMSQGLYNHSTIPLHDDSSEDQE